MSENRKVFEAREWVRNGCDLCVFKKHDCESTPHCDTFPCQPYEREDGKNVYWVEVEE